MNELRGKLFWSRLRKNGKVVDLALLPPCASTLRKHTDRADYVGKMWRNAKEPLQNLDSFVDNGWLEDGNIDWIEQMFPDDLEHIFMNTESFGNDDDSVAIELNDLSDIEDEDE